jgi:hypothetical protein
MIRFHQEHYQGEVGVPPLAYFIWDLHKQIGGFLARARLASNEVLLHHVLISIPLFANDVVLLAFTLDGL